MSSKQTEEEVIQKVPTGIPGFDSLSFGGLSQGKTTLISGTAGSAKTILACQFLVEGIKRGENVVFLTFEEPAQSIRKNMRAFNWEIKKWEYEGKWTFVDASPQNEEREVVTGDYDLGAMLARLEYAINKINARRVAIDSLGALFNQLSDTSQIRSDLLKTVSILGKLRVTSVITAERTQEYGEITRYGVEEFVTDNLVILRNVLVEEKRRRTIEILKYRGSDHQKGEFPFTIVSGEGINIIPLSDIELKQKSSSKRVTSGSQELDIMCGGGFFQGSTILVSGATGTGKTLMATKFIDSGINEGERCILFGFEESREQIFRNAASWGSKFEEMEQGGQLRVTCRYPESTSLEAMVVLIRNEILAFQPNRIAVDSLSALERVTNSKGFREFIIGLTAFLKEQEITALFTATTPTLIGGVSITESNISTITDSIILLRYIEMYGEMRRGLTAIKMRGSKHDKQIREFSIDHQGMHIGKAFRNVTGILTGTTIYTESTEVDRLTSLFNEGNENYTS